MATFTVYSITTDYNQIQEGTIEGVTFEDFVKVNGLVIVSQDAQKAIVTAEWGNSEGFDTYEVTFNNVEPSESFEITSELLGDGRATFESIKSLVNEWDYEGWQLSVIRENDDVTVYAVRTDEDTSPDKPSKWAEWRKFDDDTYYMVVAKK